MTSRNGFWWMAAGAGLSLLVTAACTSKGANEAKAAATPAQPRNPLRITPPADLLKQLKVGEPEWAIVAGRLRVAGQVEADETRIARVSSPLTGRIMELEVVEGQNVKRGQLVAVIRSTELTDAQNQFLKANSQRQLAERAVDRAKRLLEAGVIGAAELQRREAELSQANSEVGSSRDELRVLGMPEDDITKLQTTRTVNSVAQVLATIDGTVLERKATLGQVVSAADTVCVLADLSQVWLVADVPEQAAGGIEVGKQVEAEIAAFPGQMIHGRLSFVSATVNPETRTVRTRMDLPNQTRRYKPAMLATMELKDDSRRQRVLPSSALVREGNETNVFVLVADNSFELRRVSLGEEFEQQRVLVDGVRDGERVVLDGAFHLNNERKRLALQGE